MCSSWRWRWGPKALRAANDAEVVRALAAAHVQHVAVQLRCQPDALGDFERIGRIPRAAVFIAHPHQKLETKTATTMVARVQRYNFLCVKGDLAEFQRASKVGRCADLIRRAKRDEARLAAPGRQREPTTLPSTHPRVLDKSGDRQANHADADR